MWYTIANYTLRWKGGGCYYGNSWYSHPFPFDVALTSAMSEKKQPERIKPIPELRTAVTEILVANGRSVQPFVRTLHATEENVARSSLGTLIGVFEIDDQSEDSAYIVNFLASVAKKEFFSNPRRGAIESFEAALHKINLALAELVKHGNVAWLGKLHGAIGILEKNNLHFSVTGHAKILLLRSGTLADISLGLASEESHTHPIKTFVEVSSGRLSVDDQVLLSSPELLALFSLADLSKTAGRMDHQRFTQFLKTALVNELDMAGLVVVNIEEDLGASVSLTKTPTPRTEKKEKPPVANVFSQSAFQEKQARKTATVAEALAEKAIEDYVDSKTGHIYVQGLTPQAPGEHPALDAWRLTLQDFFHALGESFSASGKALRKTLSKSASVAGTAVMNTSHSLARQMKRSLKRTWQKYLAEREAAREEKAAAYQETPLVTPTEAPEELSESISFVEEQEGELQKTAGTNEAGEIEELPDFIKEKLALFYQRERAEAAQNTQTKSTFGTMLTHFADQSRTLASKVLPLFRQTLATIHLPKTRPPHTTLLLGGAFLLFLGGSILVYFLLRTNTAPAPMAPQTIPETPLSQDDRGNSSTTQTNVVSNTSEPIIGNIILDDESFLVTEKTVTAVASHQSYSIPGGSPARLVAAMDNLRLLFVLTETGKLYAFSPIRKSFVENTLTLPAGAKVEALGAYLTYLYVLDSTTDQIYRFPRAEGGFGAGTAWLKDTITLESNAHMTVSDTIFLSSDPSTVRGYFRGRATSTLEVPEGGLAVTALYTHPGLQNIYALDSAHQSVYTWNQEGKLVNTYSDPAFVGGMTLSVDETQGQIFIGTETSLLSYKLK